MRSARELQARSFLLDDHLRDGSLDGRDGALAFLARQRRRDSKADTRTCLDKFLPAQPACTSGLHALGEHLVHDVLQQALLARDVERKCIAWRRGGVAERNWMCMTGEAVCEGFVTASMRLSTARIASTFSYSELKIDGVFRRMLMPSEAETARRAGTAAEKTNEVPLIC